MREIEAGKRLRVVQLFLEGVSYEEISQRVGISKGSVVNVVEEFRDGDIDVSSNASAYIDMLRVVAVEIRKAGTNISQVMKCLPTYQKIEEMGATTEQVEQWLDTCRDLASPTASGSRLVDAAMELIRLSHETGRDYTELLADFDVKTVKMEQLKQAIVQAEARLNNTVRQNEEQKDKACRELDTISKSIKTAHETFQKQKDSLKSELDNYLTRNKLDWKKVQLAVAMFDNEIARGGLSERYREVLAERLRSAGSLKNIVEQLIREKNQLEPDVKGLKQEKLKEAEAVKQMKQEWQQVKQSLVADNQRRNQLKEEMDALEATSRQYDTAIADKHENLYVSHLIIGFLFAPKAISDRDLDNLVNMMITLRQQKLGIEPKRVTDEGGTVICQCQVPHISRFPKYDEAKTDDIRIKLAYFLAPLVKDKFVSRFDHEMAIMRHETDKIIAVTEAITEERNRQDTNMELLGFMLNRRGTLQQ